MDIEGVRVRYPISETHHMLRLACATVPIVAGVDKFFNYLTNWSAYAAPSIQRTLPFSMREFILAVGIVEVLIGLVVLILPRIGGYVLASWLGLIILNILLLGRHHDLILYDAGLMLSAVALSRLSLFPTSWVR